MRSRDVVRGGRRHGRIGDRDFDRQAKTVNSQAGVGLVANALRAQQVVRVAHSPGSSPEHAVIGGTIKIILAPLPHISSHVVKAESVGLEAGDGGGVAKRIDLQVGTVVPRTMRRRPLRAPRIDFGGVVFARRGGGETNRDVPFRLKRQAILPALGQFSRSLLLVCQPVRKRLGVLPRHTDGRMSIALRKTGIGPLAFRFLRKDPVVLQSGRPEAQEGLRAGHPVKRHAERIREIAGGSGVSVHHGKRYQHDKN